MCRIDFYPVLQGTVKSFSMEGNMEREEIIILDDGVDIASMEELLSCCTGSSAPVR